MKKKTGFERFHKVKKGSALKEELRQEKKKLTKERKEFFENKRREKAEERNRDAGVGNREFKGRGSEDIKKAPDAKSKASDTSLMPLNKFIAHSGVCSRRDAAELIKAGKVKVNDQ
ncbi:MAG TPA: S4 domain-containing protein, partial [Flavisolibacter sp.]|nr:S4 domain-containing protein [Flavisolibacter sp.]